MAMRGIDVGGSANSGFKLSPVLSSVDFCIVKATEGGTFVNSYCDRVVQECISAALPWGFYHYGRNNDPVKEADFFIQSCWNYFGHGIPVLDWEEDQSAGWVNKFVRRVYERTKVWPWIYGNAWRFDGGDVERNCGRWVARYPKKITSLDYDLSGYTNKVDGLMCAWQFSESIKIPGYSGTLDGDVFYGSISQWNAYAAGDRSDSPTEPLPVITVEDGKYRVDITPK